MKTILIVDSDLGFLASFSKSLSEAGYVTLPATTGQTAITLLAELKNPNVDLLIVDLALPNTADLVTELKDRNHQLRIISWEGPGLNSDTNIQVDARLQKPSPSELGAEDQWLGMVKQFLDDDAA